MYFQTHDIVNFLIDFTFFTATYLSKARYSLYVLKVPLNPNMSINYQTFWQFDQSSNRPVHSLTNRKLPHIVFQYQRCISESLFVILFLEMFACASDSVRSSEAVSTRVHVFQQDRQPRLISARRTGHATVLAQRHVMPTLHYFLLSCQSSYSTRQTCLTSRIECCKNTVTALNLRLATNYNFMQLCPSKHNTFVLIIIIVIIID